MDAVLQITGALFPERGPKGSVPVQFDVTKAGGPLSFRLVVERPVSLADIWNALSEQIDRLIGTHLPEIPKGPWDAILDQHVQATLWIAPTAAPNGGYGAYLELLLVDKDGYPQPFTLGGETKVGPVSISLQPSVTVLGLYLGHDAAAGGLDVRAKIQTPTTGAHALRAGGSPSGGASTQMVSYPFPLPPQNSYRVFQLIYFGLGQKVGPDPVGPNTQDPIATIFAQLKSQLAANDPKTVLTKVAQNFYKPDRDWFIAAELGLRQWNLRLIFNDPAMYGIEITAMPSTPAGFFDGLLFEILYQKLGPNLGVYYGALDLPYTLRRIPMEGFILILPGFSIWIYTNGDFRVNVGWPVGPNSIGIQVDVLTGYAGFYFAKLRSGDNPGANPTVTYNPILEFGIGLAVVCNVSVNASIFSASLSISLSASLQGLLAWQGPDDGGGSLASTPGAYWFAGSASISVLLQGSVDFVILKASVTVSFQAAASFAIENGYTTLISASADVSVEVSVKIIFFTIHLSFSAHISHSFTIGSGPLASPDGPLAPGLQLGASDPTVAILRARRDHALDVLRAAVEHGLEALPAGIPVHLPARFLTPVRLAEEAVPLSPGAPTVDLYFMLQPTATYAASGTGAPAYVGMLIADSPEPGTPLPSPGAATNLELLIVKLIQWMLAVVPARSPGSPLLSHHLAEVSGALGAGSDPPGPLFGGSVAGFGAAVVDYLQGELRFRIIGVDNASQLPPTAAAIFPMFPQLVMTTSAGPVDFNAFDPTPANYAEALDIYFQDLGLVGSSPVPEPKTAAAATGSPGESLAALLFSDTVLMLCRVTIRTLLDAARHYEGDVQEAYLADALDAEGDALTTHARRHLGALAAGDELTILLDRLDYASIAGAGSRFLLHGLQLPEPWLTPADPTPQSMAGVPTGGLYTLTGQQFAPQGGAGAVTATLAPGPLAPPGWITFGDGTAPSATASTPPYKPPPMPAPGWVVYQAGSPDSPDPDVINIRQLAPLTPGRLCVELKNQIAWAATTPAKALYPLPPAITSRLGADGLSLQLSTQLAAGSPQAVDGAAALLIRLTAAPVQEAQAANVLSGSPVSGGSGYARFVYELTGTDDTTRELIWKALQTDLSTVRITALYTLPGGSAVRSDAGAELLLLRNNLSTENQVAQVGAIQLARLTALRAGSPDHNFAAAQADPAGFLRLLWELSVVHAPGYYLYYRTPEGAGLPADLFADSAPVTASPAHEQRAPAPGTSGGAANLAFLVELTGAMQPQPAVPPCANMLLVAGLKPGAAATAELFDARGAIRAWAPTYAAGTCGFEISWAAGISSPEQPTERLYQLIQYSVQAEGRYAGSAWSLPLGPEGKTNDWRYRQVLPLTAFLAAGSPSPNRYQVIGQPASLGFRLADLYGNSLPEAFATDVTPFYNDPLLPPIAWPGVSACYFFDAADPAGSPSGAVLVLAMSFDPDGLVPASASQGHRSPAHGATTSSGPVAQWRAIQAQYALIADQLADPLTRWSVVTSLIGAGIPLADPRAALQAFVGEVQEVIGRILALGSEAVGSPRSVDMAQAWPVPLAEVSLQPHDVVAIDVSIVAERPPALAAADAPEHAPNVLRAVGPVLAKLTPAAIGLPYQAPTSLERFAALFEQAFADFDQCGGAIKLAQRSGAAADPSATPTLWAVRFSGSRGFDLSFTGAVTSFALRPLNTVPITRADLSGKVHTDVDLDIWAQQFLRFMDAFLSAQTSAAIAVLDTRNGTDALDRLLAVKSDLAATIPLGLAAVLEDEADGGDLTHARDALQQSLLTGLSKAYSISTVVQAKAEVAVTGMPDDSSPVLAPPELFGAMVPPAASPQPSGSAPYTLSSAPLVLASGTQWLTSLLTVAQPTAQSNVVAELVFSASYMQHDIEIAQAHSGFVPSAWIKFVRPGDHALVHPITRGQPALIPVPLPFKPPIPLLRSHTATAAPMGSPTYPSIQAEIAAALAWDYQIDLAVNLASQDELFFDITYNSEEASPSDRLGAAPPDVAALFDALAAFLAAVDGLSARLPDILAAAFGSQAPSPEIAPQVIAEVLDLGRAVADAWPHWEALGQDAAAPLSAITDSFGLYFEFSSKTLILQGRAKTSLGSPNPPLPPGIWPTLTFGLQGGSPDGVTWVPDPARAKVVDGWWEVSLPLSAIPDFSALSLVCPGLSLAERQSGDFVAWVVRNADIGNGRAVNPAFVYVSASTTFPDRAIPLIRRASLPPIAPEQGLPAILDAILQPLATFGAGFTPSIRIEAAYRFSLGTANLPATAPVLLADGVTLEPSASPGAEVARKAAGQIADWYAERRRSRRDARLELAITLFGLVNGRRLPLVQFLQIPVVLPADNVEAWMRGQP